VATTPWNSSKYTTPDNADRINDHKDRMLSEIRANRLREAHEQQHLSQQQVADAMGVSWCRIDPGSPGPRTTGRTRS
jgi:predicted XRE-type DNA-binding protein